MATAGEKVQELGWVTIARPGYLGSRRDEMYAQWNEEYGESNWRITWVDATGREHDFDSIFQVYVHGYINYFIDHPDEAEFIARNFSYAYDETPITREQAFDPYALVGKPGVSNQFHHAALNVAMQTLDYRFSGSEPLQVRIGKPGTPPETWPSGWRWNPGDIPCAMPEWIPNVKNEKKWWSGGSVEDFYQSSKVLQVRQ